MCSQRIYVCDMLFKNWPEIEIKAAMAAAGWSRSRQHSIVREVQLPI